MKRPSPGLIVVLAAAAAVHLSVAAMGLGTLARNGFLYDDSFYAFQIARNIAHGVGPTFDGIHLTNGFQPLYVLALVPLYWLSGDAALPVHLALAMSALLTVATAYLLFRLISRRASETAALIATGAWSFSPVVMRQSANGLETSLALFLLALSTTYYVERVRAVAWPGRRRFVVMGVLLGLAFLARADLAILSLVICLDYLMVLRSRGAGAGWKSDVAAAAGTAFAVCLPWLLYGVIAVGSPLPQSGIATRFLSVAYAPFFGLGSREMIESGPTAAFVAAHLEHSAATLRVMPALHPFFRAAQKLALSNPALGGVETAANAIGVVMMALAAAWWFRRRRTSRGREVREYDFLLLFAATLIAAYSTIVFGIFFFLRYYYPVFFVGMLFAGFFIEDVILWMRNRSVVWRRGALAASGAYAAALLFMAYTSAFRTTPMYRFYDAAKWVATHTDASDTIGVFQGGAIGYLSNRRVVNLDGKVNGEALSALRAGRLGAYLKTSGVDVVMDSERVLALFLGPWSDAERRRIESENIFAGSRYGLPGWIGYRLSPPRVMGAELPAPQSRGGLAPDR